MAIHYRKDGSVLVIVGQTYPYRDSIKAIGGRFIGGQKIWHIDDTPENETLVRQLCESTGGACLNPSSHALKEPEIQRPNMLEGIPKFTLKNSQILETPQMVSKDEGLAAKNQALSISQLLTKADHVIRSGFQAPVWIIGEVQNLNDRQQTIYLNLAEGVEGNRRSDTKTVSANIWPNARKMMQHRLGKEALKSVLVDGMKIMCLCEVSLYLGRGMLSLSIQDIDLSYTKGALALAREQLLQELRAKGLDRKNKELPRPLFPFHIGLITSEGSRAEGDFLHQLSSGGFPGKVSFVPTATQGQNVIKEVVLAIHQLTKQGCDLIVMTRGGGSAADLRWFDAKEIAYVVATCPVPIIAAIGHHDDQSIVEEICFLRAKTPTAAAELCLSWFAEIRDYIMELSSALAHRLAVRLDRDEEKFQRLRLLLNQRIESGFAKRRELLLATINRIDHLYGFQIKKIEQKFAQYHHQLSLVAMEQLYQKEKSLDQLNLKLTKLDPLPWLLQGWTQLAIDSKKVLSVNDLEVGSHVQARLLDGILSLEVHDKQQRSKVIGSKMNV